MLKLNSVTGNPLPAASPYIRPDQFRDKEATGFVLMEGELGPNAKFYIGRLERTDHPAPVARFFGGTAVPFPHSNLSTGVQSLIRLQKDLDIALRDDMANDFIQLHIFWSAEITMHARIDDPNSAAAQIPNIERHGLLPAETSFIEGVRDKLEQVWIDSTTGKLCIESNLMFNNGGMIPILRHLLTQGSSSNPPTHKVVTNPEWRNDDYTPRHDE